MRRSRRSKSSTPRWKRRGREAVEQAQVAVAAVAFAARRRHRYVGQEHAVTVELPIELFRTQDRDGIKQRFDAVHETRYGYSAPARRPRS